MKRAKAKKYYELKGLIKSSKSLTLITEFGKITILAMPGKTRLTFVIPIGMQPADFVKFRDDNCKILQTLQS